MAMFLIIVLTVYTLVNLYIFMRGLQALEGAPSLKRWYIVLFAVVFCAYIAGRFMMHALPGAFSSLLIWIGSFWLACMLYFFLIVLLLDLTRLLNLLFHFYPGPGSASYAGLKLITLVVSVALVLLLIIGGTYNAYHPRVRTLDLTMAAKESRMKNLNIVMASDIHLGTIVGRNRFSDMVEKMNALNPDIVLLVGDVVDEDIDPVVRRNLGEMLVALKSRYGTWAVPGNHEYIGGAQRAFAYLEAHQVHLLRDSVVCIDSSFYLAGREDRDKKRFTGNGRKELSELLAHTGRDLPLILMDHQPFDFGKVVEAGVDLQLSGHTHRGQMWPFNYITKAMYETDHGYLKKEATQFYVSCGAGTWGPPIRIGHRPEIVQIRVKFI